MHPFDLYISLLGIAIYPIYVILSSTYVFARISKLSIGI